MSHLMLSGPSQITLCIESFATMIESSKARQPSSAFKLILVTTLLCFVLQSESFGMVGEQVLVAHDHAVVCLNSNSDPSNPLTETWHMHVFLNFCKQIQVQLAELFTPFRSIYNVELVTVNEQKQKCVCQILVCLKWRLTFTVELVQLCNQTDLSPCDQWKKLIRKAFASSQIRRPELWWTNQILLKW